MLTEKVSRRGFFGRILREPAALAGLIFFAGGSAVTAYMAAGTRPSRLRGPVVLGSAASFPVGRTDFPVHRVALYRDAAPAGYVFRALSLVCTHMDCIVRPHDAGFTCACHGAKFDNSGRVLHGPATEPLRRLRVELNAREEVVVFLS